MICKLEGLIKSSGLKKKFVADKIGVSPHQLRNYEKGHSLIPIDKAFILCDLLNCKVEDLYERTDQTEST